MMKRFLGLNLVFLALAACSTSPEIPLAITRSGFLTSGSAVEETIAGPQVEHHWVFTGTADQAVEILFQAEDNLPTLTVRAPDGSTLREVRGQAYQNMMALSLILPAAGNYAVVVSMPAAETSAYRLVLQAPGAQPIVSPTITAPPSVPALNASPGGAALPTVTLPIPGSPTSPPRVGSGTRLTSHQPVTGMLADRGASEHYTIVGNAGDTISISAAATAGSQVTPHLILYAPSGQILAETDSTASPQPVRLNGLVLPVTGAYIVYIRDSAGSATGLYELTFGFGYTTHRRMQVAPLPDTPVNGMLDTPAVQDAWPVALNLGDIISAAVVVETSSELDPLVQLVSPDGQIIYTDDNSGGGSNAALRQVIAPASGTFYLTVSPARQDSLGPYTLIWRYDAAAPTPTQ
ncbi:MAG: hypothetical protein JXN59_15835 [Anaerolineae bacterium]|nr:hypothetical protein [Anaerolineae bacterium]